MYPCYAQGSTPTICDISASRSGRKYQYRKCISSNPFNDWRNKTNAHSKLIHIISYHTHLWINVIAVIYKNDKERNFRWDFISLLAGFFRYLSLWRHQMETYFPRYWPVERGIHRSPVNSPHKGQWHGPLMFSLICTWINAWVNKRDAGNLRRHRAHYNVIVMIRCWKRVRYAEYLNHTNVVLLLVLTRHVDLYWEVLSLRLIVQFLLHNEYVDNTLQSMYPKLNTQWRNRLNISKYISRQRINKYIKFWAWCILSTIIN